MFHEEALREVCARSGRFAGALVEAPGADGEDRSFGPPNRITSDHAQLVAEIRLRPPSN